jgi:uncharacterized protein
MKEGLSRIIKIIVLWSSVLLISLNWAQISLAVSLYEIPNPRDREIWVSDSANLLDTDTENQLNRILDEVNYKYRSELIIVTVPDTSPYQSPKQLASYLFNIWHMNRLFFYNTALFLISKGDRCAEIKLNFDYGSDPPSYAQELLYATAKNITKQNISNYFREDSYTKGILIGTKELILAIEKFLFTDIKHAPQIDLTLLDR